MRNKVDESTLLKNGFIKESDGEVEILKMMTFWEKDIYKKTINQTEIVDLEVFEEACKAIWKTVWGGLDMKEFIEYIVKHLVDKPEEVIVNEIIGERIVVYELKVWRDDLGKVIGRRGQIVKSIQTLLTAASAKKKTKRPLLEILKQ
jgi:predicted RNA-binding protein YlqC (UPF0109 family)